MTRGFYSRLQVEDDDGFPFTLLQALIFVSAILGLTITVPAGFRTDYASIPRLLWAILPPIGKYDRAAVVHDKLYQDGAVDGRSITRSEADRVLLEAMEVLGVGRIARALIYAGVRVGGALIWRKYRKAQAVSV